MKALHGKQRGSLAFRLFLLLILVLIMAFSMSRAEPSGVVIEATNKNALILLPILHENGKSWSPVIDDLESAGYKVTTKVDNKVNLELLRNISDYSVIFINTHGTDPDRYGDYYFLSSERYSEDVYRRNRSDFNDNLLKHGNIEGGSYFLVSPQYIKKYNYDDDTGERFQDALLYFRSCWSMRSDRLTSALKGIGIQILIGYERGSVGVEGEYYRRGDDVTTVEFFDLACRQDVIAEHAFKQIYDPGFFI